MIRREDAREWGRPATIGAPPPRVLGRRRSTGAETGEAVWVWGSIGCDNSSGRELAIGVTAFWKASLMSDS